MLLTLIMLTLASSPPAPIIMVPSPADRRERVARGPIADMDKLEFAAKRCGFKDVGLAVPDGLAAPTSISIKATELRSPNADCLRAWRKQNPLPKSSWFWK